jgi:ABC-type nitrate/sulfonate/bicarbonate transport system ATPase subunit
MTPAEQQVATAPASPALPKIVVDDLCLKYPVARQESLSVLEGVSFSIFPQEVVCIVGPSGCGKTSILNILAGFIAPTSGELRIDGRPVQYGDRTRGVGVVFQEDAVFPWYTVRKNVEYGLRFSNRSRSEQARKVDAILELLRLSRFANMYPRDLSGGMRKRCDIGRALAIDPEVLLMDEPFAALDVITKEHLQVEFGDLWAKSGATVLFVTHDLEEAIFLGDRVAVMGATPGPFREVTEIPFERPRAVALKTTPAFQEIRAHLIRVLDA